MTNIHLFDDEIDILEKVAKSIVFTSMDNNLDPGNWNFPIRSFIEQLRIQAHAMKDAGKFGAMIEDMAKDLLVHQYNVNIRTQEAKKLVYGDGSGDPNFPSGLITKEKLDRILSLAMEMYELSEKEEPNPNI